jgi:sulfonate dioxygenase
MINDVYRDSFRRLSPAFQSMMNNLKATHSSANMINHTRAAGGLVRKDPVNSLHPVVRHPNVFRRRALLNHCF